MARLLLIDDDDTTREVLGLLLRADGWDVAEAANGDAAVVMAEAFRPEVVLSDLQMPGLCGAPLAAALRAVCDEGVTLLAMTATRLPTTPDGFDTLLEKPFAADAVREAVAGVSRRAEPAAGLPVLAKDTFARMTATMPAAQVRSLYDFALDDAERRVNDMEMTSDDEAFRHSAHALKGSSGMIGAMRLHALASAAEDAGLPVSSIKSKLFQDFRGEMLAVRRMLEELFSNDI